MSRFSLAWKYKEVADVQRIRKRLRSLKELRKCSRKAIAQSEICIAQGKRFTTVFTNLFSAALRAREGAP